MELLGTDVTELEVVRVGPVVVLVAEVTEFTADVAEVVRAEVIGVVVEVATVEVVGIEVVNIKVVGVVLVILVVVVKLDGIEVLEVEDEVGNVVFVVALQPTAKNQ